MQKRCCILEKLLNENDRIRRAEEIYYRRKNGIHMTQDLQQKKKPKRKTNYLFHILILINLITIVYAIQNKEYIFSETFIQDMTRWIEQDINVGEKINKVKQYFQDNMYVVENLEETTPATEENSNASQAEEIEEKTNQTNEDTLDTETVSSVSQMDADISAIKENYAFVWPLNGTITSSFGIRDSDNTIVTKYHTGLDIAAPKGTPIAAAASGTVTFSGYKGSYGYMIVISHGNNIQTYYGHCSKLYVSAGTAVSQGQTIAAIGSTGNSTGPHLHLEVRINGVAYNPQNYVY